jgi:hypothetical protein
VLNAAGPSNAPSMNRSCLPLISPSVKGHTSTKPARPASDSEMVGTVRKFEEPVRTKWPGVGVVVHCELDCAHQWLARSLDLINDERPRAECQEADGIRERGDQGALLIQAPQRPSAELALDQRGLACPARAGHDGYPPGGDGCQMLAA